MNKPLNMAIVGLGYWGPNYARIIHKLAEGNLLWCADLNEENLKKIKERYPNIKTTTNYGEIVADPELDAVLVITPVSSHYEITKCFLEKGKHVLVEKPFTETVEQAEDLTRLAKSKNLILMVGHVYLFNPAVSKLKELIETDQLGDVYYIKAERVGLGPIRKQASALWDLATHDVSVALYLIGIEPIGVSAQGGAYLQNGVEDFVNLILRFPQKIFASTFASWYAPEKTRKTIVVGSKGMVVFDDVNKKETLKLYRRGIDTNLLNVTPEYHDHQNIVLMGKTETVLVENTEPLKNQVLHFIDCVVNKKQPLTDGRNGQRVVKVLRAAENILRRE